MPSRPGELLRYPHNWPQISLAIRSRAEGRCECSGQCGLHRGRRCEELNGEPAKWARGKVMLTVAHLNHAPEDCREENLAAMCQTCHLRYDRLQHGEASARTRDEKRRAGQGALFEETK